MGVEHGLRHPPIARVRIGRPEYTRAREAPTAGPNLTCVDFERANMNSCARASLGAWVSDQRSKAIVYRHRAGGLRALAHIMERSTSRIELLAEAARWER